MHPVLFLLASLTASAWSAFGIYLIRTRPPERLFVVRSRWLPVVIFQVILAIAVILALVLIAPIVFLVAAGSGMEPGISLVGLGIWGYGFGFLPFAYAPFSNPRYSELPGSERRRIRIYVFLFGATFPITVLTSALLGVFLVGALPIPFLQEALSRPAKDSLHLAVPFILGFFSSLGVGGYAGYRFWRALASRFLPSTLVSAIVQPEPSSFGNRHAKDMGGPRQ